MSRSIDTKAQLWTKRLREFDASSLSVDQFCKSVGCSSPTFYQWRRKLAAVTPAKSSRSASTSQPSASPQSTFLHIQSNSDYSIQVKLLSGVVITIPVEVLDCLPQVLDRIA